MKKIIAAMLSAAFVCAPVTVSAEEAQDVTMAFCTWTGYSPMFIAQEQGYFEEAGINMDIQVIEDESTYAALITTGNVQFLATAQDPNIKMYANGADSRFVLTMDASNGADGLVATGNIESLDDLAGKKLALDKSASSYYFFLTALEQGSSLTEDDIDVIDMGDTTEAGLAFMSGTVDAAIMWEPELSEALETVEGAHALVTSADYPDTILDSLVVNTKYAEENPEVVEAVAQAWYKAVDFLNENPEEAYEMMASGFEEVSAEDIASDVEGLIFYGEEENAALNDEGSDASIYSISQKMADFWMEKGECETDDLTDFFALVK
ncbi:MAG: ABC transporter substrate-binding protein [Blautia sp.]|nr:ABC transporter substrate-binding protein [Blautia sp.]MDY5030331.1 ABC transporter substrate-binding protein [Blautia sp.]